MTDKQKVVAKVTKEELEELFSIQAKMEAIKETIDELMEKRGELEKAEAYWWIEIGGKYNLDFTKRYHLHPPSGEILEATE